MWAAVTDALLFSSMGYEISGIDVSHPLIEQARTLCPTTSFQVASVYALPFHDTTFDGAWAAASLLHLPKNRLLEALSEISRILTDNGQLAVIFKQGSGEGLEERKHGLRYFAYYSQDELCEYLRWAGFEVTRCDRRVHQGDTWLCAYSRKII